MISKSDTMLVLACHGENDNQDRLTEKGKEQARLAGQHIKGFIASNESVEQAIKRSPWTSVSYHCSMSPCTGQTLYEIHNIIHGGHREAGREELLCSERALGESLMDVYIRAGLFMERFQWFSRDKLAVVSSHKEFLTMLHQYIVGKPSEGEWENGEVRIYKVQPWHTGSLVSPTEFDS